LNFAYIFLFAIIINLFLFIALYEIQYQYLDRCSRFVKAIDTRLKEIKLMKAEVEAMKPDVIDIEKTLRVKKKDISDKLKPEKKVKPEKRKKLKDEFLELREVEKQFFEIVRKVISNWFKNICDTFWW